ncbi:hypothetical protein SAY86_019957 [Trapa natans]|uniref:Uncharacterized protein n=1 Tax=Trapa natans TaxID=22666 RepID=A0AAN7LI75_TRANT|nr:hypothetical protein SAY86_019957 [Trapa natans]
MCGFDLLATVAGDMLLDKDARLSSGSSSSYEGQSSVKEAVYDKVHQNEYNDQGEGSEFKAKDDSINSAIEVWTRTDDRSNPVQDDEAIVHNKLNIDKFVYRSSTDLCSLGGPVKSICDDRKVVSRDDDDKLFGCTRLSPMKKSTKPFNSVPRVCGRRIRKVLTSRCWHALKSRSAQFNRSGELI